MRLSLLVNFCNLPRKNKIFRNGNLQNSYIPSNLFTFALLLQCSIPVWFSWVSFHSERRPAEIYTGIREAIVNHTSFIFERSFSQIAQTYRPMTLLGNLQFHSSCFRFNILCFEHCQVLKSLGVLLALTVLLLHDLVKLRQYRQKHIWVLILFSLISYIILLRIALITSLSHPSQCSEISTRTNSSLCPYIRFECCSLK